METALKKRNCNVSNGSFPLTWLKKKRNRSEKWKTTSFYCNSKVGEICCIKSPEVQLGNSSEEYLFLARNDMLLFRSDWSFLFSVLILSTDHSGDTCFKVDNLIQMSAKRNCTLGMLCKIWLHRKAVFYFYNPLLRHLYTVHGISILEKDSSVCHLLLLLQVIE